MSDSTDTPHPTRDSVEQRLRAGVEHSRLAATTRTLTRYVRHSWCYRWLTKEPDPDVIVIDLRETYTVGPFIRLLDTIVARFAQTAASSRAGEIGHNISHRFERRPLRILGVTMLAAVVASTLFSLAFGHTGTVWIGSHIALAGAAALGFRSDRTLEDLTETRPWKLLSEAFEPPEPPTTEDTPEDHTKCERSNSSKE